MAGRNSGPSCATKWTAIALTCQDTDSAQAIQQELEFRQKKGQIEKDVLLLTVEDPQARIGSGGATLNALLVVAEHLSQQHGHTVTTSDVLFDTRILIMHVNIISSTKLEPVVDVSREFPYDSCGRALTTLPVQPTGSSAIGYDSLITNLDCLLDTITNKISVGSPAGVWVCSTDMLLTVSKPTTIDWQEYTGVCAFAVPASEQYAKNHGMYRLKKESTIVEDIMYHGGATAMKMCSMPDEQDPLEKVVPLVSGLVFFSGRAAERLLSLHVLPGLDACTYMGLDSGVKPINLSLFFDILLCMCNDVEEDSFVSGEQSRDYDKIHRKGMLEGSEAGTLKSARALLWKKLRGIEVKAVVLKESSYNYMTMSGADHLRHLTFCPLQVETDKHLLWSQLNHAFVGDGCNISDGSLIINSALEGSVQVGPKSVISHCHLKGTIHISKDSILSNIDVGASQSLVQHKLSSGIILQGFQLRLGGDQKQLCKVYTIMGKFDSLQTAYIKGTSTFCNSPWVVFLTRTGIDKEDLWPVYQTDYDRTLFNAKLFPVWNASVSVGIKEVLWLEGGEQDEAMLKRWRSSWRLSLEELLSCVDLPAELQYRRSLFCTVGLCRIENVLQNNKNQSLLPFFKTAAIEGFAQQALQKLDQVAMTTDSPGVAARCLACIADVLGAMAGDKGGLRSGPAANKAFQMAFTLLRDDRIADGIQALSKERSNWLDRPEHLVRAARHYEGAEQILIGRAIMLSKQFISLSPCEPTPMDKWVTGTCPARIDIAGGWSDTPSITYERGGAVCDVAIQVDGKRPIGAKVKRIAESHLVLVLDSDQSHSVEVVCRELSDLADYNNPKSPGALLKAAFCCAEVISLPSSQTLQEQLQERYGGGYELHTWSNLPHGSGLGTSSILAGAILAVLWRASGKSYDHQSLIHAVLHLEQMLTTGGGWQDQVGGLTAKINIGHCQAALPLKVDIDPVEISEETHKKLNKHLLLVYTGRTRLARNILQDVLRNWHAKAPYIVENCNELVENAWKCVDALKEGDVERVGGCMDTYWSQKKVMAPGSEPLVVQRMMKALRPYVYGQALAGAGGGGFMYLLTKEPNAMDSVKAVLASVEGTQDITIHTVTLDEEGLTVHVEG